MSVWCVLPSIRPAAQVEPILHEWLKRGYKVAIMRDGPYTYPPLFNCHFQMQSPNPYLGWAAAINTLTRDILFMDPQAEWIVAGGDDLLPIGEYDASRVAAQCTNYFYDLWMDATSDEHPTPFAGSTFGVMQPTGDRYITPGSTLPYPDVEHSACSPWIGREFCERTYGGNGPMWEGYRYYWGDNELQEVAKKLSCFWQRPDLTQLHQHWSRDPNAACPEHLRAAHEGGAEVDRLLFESRKAAGFPGHELKGER